MPTVAGNRASEREGESLRRFPFRISTKGSKVANLTGVTIGELRTYIRERSSVLEELQAELTDSGISRNSARWQYLAGQREALNRLSEALAGLEEALNEKLPPGELDPRD